MTWSNAYLSVCTPLPTCRYRECPGVRQGRVTYPPQDTLGPPDPPTTDQPRPRKPHVLFIDLRKVELVLAGISEVFGSYQYRQCRLGQAFQLGVCDAPSRTVYLSEQTLRQEGDGEKVVCVG